MQGIINPNRPPPTDEDYKRLDGMVEGQRVDGMPILKPRKISLDMASVHGCEQQFPAQLMCQAFDKLQPHRLAASGIEIHGKSNAIVLDDHAHHAIHTMN